MKEEATGHPRAAAYKVVFLYNPCKTTERLPAEKIA